MLCGTLDSLKKHANRKHDGSAKLSIEWICKSILIIIKKNWLVH